MNRGGDRIVLEGEADQVPGQQPGSLVFILKEADHDTFTRAGSDLQAPLNITLAEALCGFSRVVLKHLDGRGIQITQPQGRILRPNQVLKVSGEGMPYKKSDVKGDLYLVVNVQFPEDSWAQDKEAVKQLQQLLPIPEKTIPVDVVDEVEYELNADLDDVRFCSRAKLQMLIKYSSEPVREIQGAVRAGLTTMTTMMKQMEKHNARSSKHSWR